MFYSVRIHLVTLGQSEGDQLANEKNPKGNVVHQECPNIYD